MGKFDLEEEDMLISLVELHAILYDVANPNYKNIRKRYEAWKQISDKLGKSSEECMKKWANIRDYYVRMKKRGLNSSNKSHRLEMLKFLEDHTGTVRRTSSNIEKESSPIMIETDSSAPSCSWETIAEKRLPLNASSTPKTKRPRKEKRSSRQNIDKYAFLIEYMKKSNEKQTKEEDNVDLFAKSLGQTIKTFPARYINQIKIDLLKVITEWEKKNLSDS